MMLVMSISKRSENLLLCETWIFLKNMFHRVSKRKQFKNKLYTDACAVYARLSAQYPWCLCDLSTHSFYLFLLISSIHFLSCFSSASSRCCHIIECIISSKYLQALENCHFFLASPTFCLTYS